MNVAIYIEEQKLDLFSDETIEITSSIVNANDITKNTIDFSKNFNVPATDNNNKIFKHWYRADVDNGFDHRTKTKGKIEINGVVFKYGKFSLIAVKLKQNKPSSYSLVFYGNGISLVDKLGNDELSSLDLKAFDHAYSDLNVAIGLGNVGLFGRDIRYPLIAKKRYYYNSSGTNDGAEVLNNHSNIANVGWANGVNWIELRASLRIIRIIEAIEIKYNIQFSRNFFGGTNFYDLYLWLDNEKQKDVSSEVQVDFNNTGNVFPTYTNYIDIDLVNNNFNFKNVTQSTLFLTAYDVHPSVGYESVPYTRIKYHDGVEVERVECVGYNRLNQDKYDFSKKRTFKIKSNTEFKFTMDFNFNIGALGFKDFTTPQQTISVNYEIKNQIPKIKTIDFLKGLFSMFKLVFVQEKDADPIYVNTLNNYYSEAALYDITEYVSTNSADVERGKLLNEISYKFEDPQTILAKQFKANNGIAFGDAEIKLTEDGTPNSPKLDGEKEEIKVPFEQVVYERLKDLNGNSPTNIQYGAVIDDKYDSVNLRPLIHYISDNDIHPNALKFVMNNGSSVVYYGMVSTPTVMMDGMSGENGLSLTFDREQNSYTGGFNDNSLYNVFHADYITSIFNFKRRNFKFEAKLPLRIILKLKLKDVLKINDSYYRINTWTYNLLTGKCKLDLINSFDNTINGFNASRTIINTDSTAKIESIFVTNFTNMIFDYTASWINSATYLGNNVYFGIDVNDTGLFRAETIRLINADTLAEIEITINQSPNIITFGNEIITWGQTDITFEL